MLQRSLCLLVWVFFLLWSGLSLAAEAHLAMLINVTGAIGPATQDFLERSFEQADKQHAEIIILRIDTPGGLETAMHGIDKAILSSKVPVVSYVAPSGARAASAGTFLLYASHIAAMAPGTNLGAASPVGIGGGGEEGTKKSQDVMGKKVTNDAVAAIRSLAELRGRNADWAEAAVRKAASLSATQALQLHVIDLIADNIPDLLQKIEGRNIQMPNGPHILHTANATLEELTPDWRFQFLSVITDPSVAYILLLIGIYGLFFEFSNPGFILPGIVGVISLLLALYAFQLLPISYVGLALILLGITFLIVEVFISSFGVLGIGGVVAFATGSVLLLDTNVPGYAIAWPLILVMSLVTAAFFLIVLSLAIGSTRKAIVSGREALLGGEAEVLEYHDGYARVRMRGEIWQAGTTVPLQIGQKVKVTEISGLILKVEPIKD